MPVRVFVGGNAVPEEGWLRGQIVGPGRGLDVLRIERVVDDGEGIHSGIGKGLEHLWTYAGRGKSSERRGGEDEVVLVVAPNGVYRRALQLVSVLVEEGVHVGLQVAIRAFQHVRVAAQPRGMPSVFVQHAGSGSKAALIAEAGVLTAPGGVECLYGPVLLLQVVDPGILAIQLGVDPVL